MDQHAPRGLLDPLRPQGKPLPLADQARQYWLLNRLLRSPDPADQARALQAMRLIAKLVHPVLALRYRNICHARD